MKSFIKKLILACIPFIVYLTVFTVYEPYNYWGLKAEKSGSWATPLARVREFMRRPSENLILGDSRMNHFDKEAVEKKTGVYYANLSTGGQGLNLSRELYEWAKGKSKIDNLIIDASFYQIRNGNESPSAAPVFAIAEKPLSYIVTRDYVTEAFGLCLKDVKKHFVGEEPAQTPEPDIKDPRYRDDLLYYATQNILPGCQGYAVGEQQMADLVYILDDTVKGGGTPLVVVPPVQESIWDYVIYPLELEDELESYKSVLQRHAAVYDGEWISGFAKNQDIYADGFHFLNGDGYEQFENAVFLGEGEIFKVRKKISGGE